MGPEDARRVVSQLRSGLSGPIAAAINALTVISADATDPMSTQDWPGLAGALCLLQGFLKALWDALGTF